MKFNATEEQVKQIAANAVNASVPVGMGHIHFRPGDYAPEDIEVTEFGVEIDYFHGRMVKLYIKPCKGDSWETRGQTRRTLSTSLGRKSTRPTKSWFCPFYRSPVGQSHFQTRS